MLQQGSPFSFQFGFGTDLELADRGGEAEELPISKPAQAEGRWYAGDGLILTSSHSEFVLSGNESSKQLSSSTLKQS
jgi:hypothetical protein